LIYIAFKTTFFFKISETFGLQQALLFGVVRAVLPFLAIFFFFILFFASLSAILGNNQNLAESFVNTPLAFGYFF
jgi:hypothetical protein